MLEDFINKYQPEEFKGNNSFKINENQEITNKDRKKCCLGNKSLFNISNLIELIICY